MRMNKKISIIIPCYNTEKYIERCLDSIIKQTYKNLEIIVVNDCSTDNSLNIIEEYRNKDNRIKIVNHEKNKGLFHARLSGAKNATGEYIAFLDSDDYVEKDFYRELLTTLINTNSDMTICNTVREETNNKYIFNLFKTGREIIEGNDILDEYFKQEGKNYRWHTIWNKLYTMKLWKKCEKEYSKITEHLIMTEDFAYSTVLFYNAQKISYNDNASIFYCANEDASTSTKTLTKKKIFKNINDLITSFNFVENFLKEKNIFEKYHENFKNWKTLYSKIWKMNIHNANISNDEIIESLEKLSEFNDKFDKVDIPDQDNFYLMKTKWNDGLSALKDQIIESDIISFDIFDTLILRPFLEPKDLFVLLNSEFNRLFNSNGLIEFSKMRVETEQECRSDKEQKNIEEITLDEIYTLISKKYKLDLKKLNIIKELEINLEKKFCTERKIGKSLYKLSEQLGKTIIITSDMYLPKKVIEEILAENGYTHYKNLYLSNEIKKTKHKGTIYKYINSKYKNKKILHIGDNYWSDVEKARENNINAAFLPKASDIFFNYNPNINCVNNCGKLYENFENLNIDHGHYLEHMGNKCALAIVANKFFDNPFISFNHDSDFNIDPYMIGYYNLGMHTFTLSKWLLDNIKEKKYDSIAFMARDGYIPYLATQKMSKIYSMPNLNINYTYVSRKALFPLTIKEFKDLYKFKEYFYIKATTVKQMLEILSPILNLEKGYEKILKTNKIKLKELIDTEENFNKIINVVYNHFYSEKKYNNYLEITKKYFNTQFIGNCCTFDIGYSGQPELIISDLLQKPINTFFIHTNSDSGFNKSKMGNFDLETFYQFKPTFTGTLREYVISSTAPSCIGYKETTNEKVEAVFEKESLYTYYDIKILEEMQNGCLDFIDNYINIFKEDLLNFEINNYYMSVPFEYFMCYSKYNDRMIFKGLKFETNVGEKIEMNDYWNYRINEYNGYCNKYSSKMYYDSHWNFIEERVRYRNIFIKGLFYLLYDRPTLKKYIGEKTNYQGLFYNGLRKTFHGLKKIKRIFK